jgi:hypothetical protein
MSDESKLGLVAGVLAVVGVAVFSFPKEPPKEPVKPAVTVTAPTPPAVVPGK